MLGIFVYFTQVIYIGYMDGKEYRMRKSDAVLGFSRVVIPGLTGNLLLVILLAFSLVACGGDSGTSVNDDNESSSSVIQSGDSHEGSSNSKQSSSSKKGDAGKTSSSSAKTSSSSSKKIASSSSSVKTASSSSSVIPASSGNLPSSSSKKVESSSSQKIASSSSSVKASSSSAKIVSSSSVAPASSSSKKAESSSSEYVPFDHKKTLANSSKVGKDAYKQFTDPRNGRSYYYITITSTRKETKGKSVTVMAENLNIGEMVLGTENQRDDNKIERYCYNNDTTKCDEFGGLYQWAEMMQLPSRCNTESCADLILPNHQGICPDGWRLFTWDDYEIVRGYDDKFDDGIKGLRSTYGFRGTNQSGFSLTGAGARDYNGKFCNIEDATFWFFPEEDEYDVTNYVHVGFVSSVGHAPTKDEGDLKISGLSVRCVKLE